MKSPIPASLPLLLLAAAPVRALPFTYETPAEMSTQGDFNHDGRPDIAVLDRDLGTLRVLGSISGISFAGGGSHPLDMDGADALSAGTIPGGLYAVAVASSKENRVLTVVPRTGNIHDIDFGSRSHPGALAMTGTMTVNVPFLGTITRGSVHVNTDWNTGTTPARITRVTLLGTGAGDPSLMPMDTPDTPSISGLRHGNPVPWVGEVAIGCIKHETDDTSTFHLYHGRNNELSDPRTIRSQASGLPPEALWTYGDFVSQPGYIGFLFYQRGASSFTPRQTSPPINPTSNASFSAFPPQDLGAPIHLLMTVRRDTLDRLLAVLDGGARAVLYDYRIGEAPTVVNSWDAPPGEKFTQVAPLDDGSFVLLRGTSGKSTAWSRFDPSGSGQELTMIGEFCCGLQSRRLATLFYYDQEPFVSPAARLHTTVRERDWADVPASPGGLIRVFTDQGPRAGLGQPVNYFPPPGQYQHTAIPNQFTRTATGGQAPISIASLSNCQGNIAPSVAFDPPAGQYPPLQVTLPGEQPGDDGLAPLRDTFTVALSNSLGSAMQYRVSSSSAWQAYTGPITLTPAMTEDDDVTIIARVAGRTEVHPARYTFAAPAANTAPLTAPSLRDDNNNGLPDDWEAAFAQNDPHADTDGDGRTALQEYLDGTDPRDRFSVTPDPSIVAPGEFSHALQFATVTTANGRALRLWWPARYSDALLQSSDDLVTWTPVSQSIVLEGSHIVHIAPYPTPDSTSVPHRQFYRLIRAAACPCGR